MKQEPGDDITRIRVIQHEVGHIYSAYRLGDNDFELNLRPSKPNRIAEFWRKPKHFNSIDDLEKLIIALGGPEQERIYATENPIFGVDDDEFIANLGYSTKQVEIARKWINAFLDTNQGSIQIIVNRIDEHWKSKSKFFYSDLVSNLNETTIDLRNQLMLSK